MRLGGGSGSAYRNDSFPRIPAVTMKRNFQARLMSRSVVSPGRSLRFAAAAPAPVVRLFPVRRPLAKASRCNRAGAALRSQLQGGHGR